VTVNPPIIFLLRTDQRYAGTFNVPPRGAVHSLRVRRNVDLLLHVGLVVGEVDVALNQDFYIV